MKATNTFEDLLTRFGGHRRETWKAAAQTVMRQGGKNLVETGCYRGTAADGYSTLLLAALAMEVSGHLDSYELNPRNISLCGAIIRGAGLAPYVTFFPGDSVAGLAARTAPIDFVYLDSFDCGLGPNFDPCQRHSLAEFEAALPLLSPKAAVMLDDHVPVTGGKTRLTVKRLSTLGFEKIAEGYQVLYASDNATSLPQAEFAVLCGHLKSFIPIAVETIYQNKAQYALRHGYDLRIVRNCGKYTDQKTHASGFSWARLDEMLRLVESGKYGWVWCVGGDTLITNFSISLREIVALAETPKAESAPLPTCPHFPNSPAPRGIIKWERPPGHKDYGRKHLIISAERVTPMQADSFLVRGSPEGATYLRDILAQYPRYRYHPWVENQVMIDLRDKHAAITYTMPQWRLNCVDFSRWYANDSAYRDGTDCFGNRGQWIKGDFLIHFPASSAQERMNWVRLYKPKIVY